MTESKLNENTRRKLHEFKKVVDEVLGKKLDFNEYLNLILSQGLYSMIRDIITKDETIVTKSIEQMFDDNPEFVSNFILKKLKTGKEVKRDKKKFGEEWLKYIG